MKKYNIAKPEKYLDKASGQEKTYWANVGTMTEFSKQDGTVSRIVEIPAIGLKASVFEIKPKVVQPTVTKTQEDIYPTATTTTDVIDESEIPF